MSAADWWVYVVRCRDGSLYTGVAIDVAARVESHNAGTGARYTRGRGPVKVLGTSGPMSKGDALRLEAAVKRRPPAKKLAALAAGLSG